MRGPPSRSGCKLPLPVAADCVRSPGAHNPRMALEDCEFELRYDDYAQSCREAGVEPLTLEALQQLIATLTETPHATIH